MEEAVVSEIFKELAFSKEELRWISSKFKKIEMEKHTTLLSPQQKVTHQYYVYKGCLRTFYIDENNKEYTLQFAIKNWWVSDYTSYFTSEKAALNIESIKDSILFQIEKKDVEELYVKFPKIETFFRKKLEKAFASFQKRILETLSLSAKDRYLSFVNAYPNIEQNIKNYHIASYLGITTESLSRIRKEIVKTNLLP